MKLNSTNYIWLIANNKIWVTEKTHSGLPKDSTTTRRKYFISNKIWIVRKWWNTKLKFFKSVQNNIPWKFQFLGIQPFLKLDIQSVLKNTEVLYQSVNPAVCTLQEPPPAILKENAQAGSQVSCSWHSPSAKAPPVLSPLLPVSHFLRPTVSHE